MDIKILIHNFIIFSIYHVSPHNLWPNPYKKIIFIYKKEQKKIAWFLKNNSIDFPLHLLEFTPSL